MSQLCLVLTISIYLILPFIKHRRNKPSVDLKWLICYISLKNNNMRIKVKKLGMKPRSGCGIYYTQVPQAWILSMVLRKPEVRTTKWNWLEPMYLAFHTAPGFQVFSHSEFSCTRAYNKPKISWQSVIKRIPKNSQFDVQVVDLQFF